MASATLNKVTQLILPKKKANEKGVSYTSTFNPTATATVLSAPNFRNHLTDIFSTRVTSDSRALMKDLVKFDPDVSATIHAFLTVANTTPRFYVYDENNVLKDILAFYINGIAETYDITFDDGKTYSFTGNHKLKTTTGWKHVADLTEDDMIESF